MTIMSLPQAHSCRPRGREGDAPDAAQLLAPWARERCPHLKPDEHCRRVGGRCRLLGPEVQSCDWAEHGPILCSPEPLLGAYLAAVPNPIWRRARRPAWMDAPVSSVTTPAMAPTPTVRRCPDCGGPMPPRRRYCDACRFARRRETDRLNHRRWRHGGHAREEPKDAATPRQDAALQADALCIEAQTPSQLTV